MNILYLVMFQLTPIINEIMICLFFIISYIYVCMKTLINYFLFKLATTPSTRWAYKDGRKDSIAAHARRLLERMKKLLALFNLSDSFQLVLECDLRLVGAQCDGLINVRLIKLMYISWSGRKNNGEWGR